MPIHERDRIRFHNWLLKHDLDEEVADAILATMPPYDWHELATKVDLAVLEQRMTDRFALVDMRLDRMDQRLDSFASQVNGRYEQVDGRFEQVDGRFDEVDRRFEQVDRRFEQVDRRFDEVDRRFDQADRRFDQADERMAGMALEIRAIMFMLIGLIVSVLLAGAATMFG